MNQQTIEKVWIDPEGKLEVFDVWKTLQGEGPLSGTPAVFVRLAGCVLCCKGCDTDYTSKRSVMSVVEVMESINRCLRKGLVVLTGGEPLRQNTIPLIRELLSTGRTVQMETNGVIHPWGLPFDNPLFHVVCSPKGRVDKAFLYNRKVSWKYIIRADKVDPFDGLPTITLKGSRPGRPDWSVCNPASVWVQPEDQKSKVLNKANRDACVESCMKFGYRLSLQVHKILGLE